MADDNRRQMLLLLKDGEKTPTEMAKSSISRSFSVRRVHNSDKEGLCKIIMRDSKMILDCPKEEG
jgi:hypothetical protein